MSTTTYDFMAHNVSFALTVSLHVGHPSYSIHVLGWLDTSKRLIVRRRVFSDFCTNDHVPNVVYSVWSHLIIPTIVQLKEVRI